jgi:hypothetical protein
MGSRILGGAAGAEREHHRDARVPGREPVLAATALERLETLVALEVVLVEELDPQSGGRQRG